MPRSRQSLATIFALLLLAVCLWSCSFHPPPPLARPLADQNDDQLRQAVQDFKAFVSRYPQSWYSVERMAGAQLLLGKYEDALESLKLLPEAQRNESAPHMEQAVACLALGCEDQARGLFALVESRDDDLSPFARQSLYLMDRAQAEALAVSALEQEFTPGAVRPRNRIAVLPFHPLNDDEILSATARALQDFLTRDLLTASPQAAADPMLVMALVRRNGAQNKTTALGRAVRIARLSRSARAGFGNIGPNGVFFELNLGLASVASGALQHSFTSRVRPRFFFQLEKNALLHILQAEHIVPSVQATTRLRRVASMSYPAAASYGRALKALDLGQWDQAAEHLRQALEWDESFALARDMLARCPEGADLSLEDLAAWGRGAAQGNTAKMQSSTLPAKLAHRLLGQLPY
jgi:tetratricopeptide (TPR) repeat protein